MMTWDDFYDGVRPIALAAEPEIVDDRIRAAVRELCTEAHIYQEFVTPVNVVSGTASYVITPATADTELVEVKKVWVNDIPLDPIHEDRLAELYSYWPDETAEQPTHFLQLDSEDLTLFPKPSASATSGLRIKIAIRPTLDATGVADSVGVGFYDEIVAGAKALLLEMPAKPWTAPDYAKQFRAQFQSGKTNARITASRSFTRTPPRVRMSRVW